MTANLLLFSIELGLFVIEMVLNFFYYLDISTKHFDTKEFLYAGVKISFSSVVKYVIEAFVFNVIYTVCLVCGVQLTVFMMYSLVTVILIAGLLFKIRKLLNKT